MEGDRIRVPDFQKMKRRGRKITMLTAYDATMARLARQHNDANVLALGARIIGLPVAIDCLEAFIVTEFEGGRHTARVESLGKC